MSDCLFCKFVKGEIKPDVVYEDDQVLAFKDINPQAPIHVLVIPKKHIETTNDISDEDEAVVGHIIKVAAGIAKKMNISGSGYRTVFNCNKDAGQAVFHIHCHLLGGRQFDWPPG